VSTSKVYTTGEVATFTGVNFRTVIRWIEKGLLPAYRLPGSRGDHRIAHDDLLVFMQTNAMPLPDSFEAVRKSVLVVDDDQPMARAIGRVFRLAGWETFLAFDGFQAGMLLMDKRPTLMTLDLRMPGMSGYEVLSYTRQQPVVAGVKVIVISAQHQSELRAALDRGADAVLEKPFTNDALMALAEKLTGQR
jgi:two-component system, OmpR family, response regulator VicR